MKNVASLDILVVDFGTNIFCFLEMVEAMKNVAILDMESTVYSFLLAVDFGTNIFRFLEMVEAMKNVASLDMELTCSIPPNDIFWY